MQTITLTLSANQFNVIRRTLGQLPHDQIGGFIANIEQQAQAQLAPPAEADNPEQFLPDEEIEAAFPINKTEAE